MQHHFHSPRNWLMICNFTQSVLNHYHISIFTQHAREALKFRQCVTILNHPLIFRQSVFPNCTMVSEDIILCLAVMPSQGMLTLFRWTPLFLSSKNMQTIIATWFGYHPLTCILYTTMSLNYHDFGIDKACMCQWCQTFMFLSRYLSGCQVVSKCNPGTIQPTR